MRRELLNIFSRVKDLPNFGTHGSFPPNFGRQIDQSVRVSLVSQVGRIGRLLLKSKNLFFAENKSPRNMPVVESSAEKLVLKFTKVVPDAFPPTKGSVKAAGYDLKSAVDCVVPSRGKAIVDTGLKIELPTGCYGRIAPRSGLAAKNFIDVGAGVVDEDYRGILKVVLFNHSDADFEVKKGDRIAQLICERIYYPELQEVRDLTETERGEGGFGSTGTN